MPGTLDCFWRVWKAHVSMLERPDISDERIAACLNHAYGLSVVRAAFLRLGADRDSAAFRIQADGEQAYFLKLRRGAFDEISVVLPKFLSEKGIAEVMTPLATRTGRLWTSLDGFRLILYPFVEGHNGYQVDLSNRHWLNLGTALKGIHTAKVPPALIGRIRQEIWSPQWRRTVERFVERVEYDVFDDPVAAELAAFMNSRRDEVLNLVERAEWLARALQTQSHEIVLCHSDVHAGNVLIDVNDALYIVDWDNPILAPKERDLMFVGGGQMGAGRTPQQEETLFYRGYGQTQIDPIALAYYRYERIIEDIAVFCERVFAGEGGEDREQCLRYLASNFLPNGALEIAYKSDSAPRELSCVRREEDH